MDLTPEKMIHMFENIQEKELEISSEQYDVLVNDNWSWKHHFMVANSAYSMTAARGM